MIPNMGCDPEINVVTLGAKVLEKLKDKKQNIEKIISEYPSEFEISIDHIILSLDWLYAIKAINFNGREVFINAAK